VQLYRGINALPDGSPAMPLIGRKDWPGGRVGRFGLHPATRC